MANTIPNLQFNSLPNQFNQTGQPNIYGGGAQSIFMQPMGNIYGLSNSSEVGNIPIGSGVSIGLCLNESTMYIKSMQNNGPVLLGYKISPLENQSSGQPVNDNSKLEQKIEEFNSRFEKIEKAISSISKGGHQEWQI